MALALAPDALAATGQISGTVTDASTSKPIAGIEVCAILVGPESEKESESENEPPCATTNASGEYLLSSLAPGEYAVTFAPPFGSTTLDFVAQAYNNEPSPLKADHVRVAEGATAKEIDAKLQPGGGISGVVTSAASGAPVAQALVCALEVGGESGGCAMTNADGEYTILGLPAGSYHVVFLGPPGSFSSQAYPGKAHLSEAGTVSVTVGVVMPGINAALLPAPPKQPLSPGLTGPGGLPGSPEAGGKSPLAPAPLLRMTGSRRLVVVSRRSVRVRLACAQAACRGSVRLTVPVAGGRRPSKPPSAGRGATLVLATGSFSLAAGQQGVCLLRLTRAGVKRLAHVRRHPLAAELALSALGAKPTSIAVKVV